MSYLLNKSRETFVCEVYSQDYIDGKITLINIKNKNGNVVLNKCIVNNGIGIARLGTLIEGQKLQFDARKRVFKKGNKKKVILDVMTNWKITINKDVN